MFDFHSALLLPLSPFVYKAKCIYTKNYARLDILWGGSVAMGRAVEVSGRWRWIFVGWWQRGLRRQKLFWIWKECDGALFWNLIPPTFSCSIKILFVQSQQQQELFIQKGTICLLRCPQQTADKTKRLPFWFDFQCPSSPPPSLPFSNQNNRNKFPFSRQ